MSFENKINEQGSLRIFELQLTQSQFRAFARLLPEGYSLEVQPKPKKESSHKPTKKILTNEGVAIKVNHNGHTPAPSKPPARAHSSTAQVHHHHVQPLPEQIPVLTHQESATKRVLRDQKKKPQTYLEEKFPETIAVPTTSSKSAKPMSEGGKKCFNLLQKLKKHNCAGPFLQPVDVEGLGLYDYYDYVSEPMDLSTAEKKLKNSEYGSIDEFGDDIRKIWSNAMAYNAEGSTIHNMTVKMSQYFEKCFKEIDGTPLIGNDKVSELEKKVKMLTQEIAKLNKPEPVPVKKGGGSGQRVAKSPNTMNDEPMTIQEKKVLCDRIKQLQPDALRVVWEIVSKGLPNTRDNKEELVFDIDALPVRVTRELERFVKSKVAVNNKSNKNKPKEAPAYKASGTSDAGYDPNAQYYNHGANGAKYPINQQSLSQLPAGKSYMGMEIPAKGQAKDAESKSSDSSFISDSESGSDDERKHKPKPAPNYLLKQQDLANFQAGGHGSMLNSFIVK